MVAILKLKPIMLVFRAYVTSQSTLGRLDNSDTVTTFCSTLCPLTSLLPLVQCQNGLNLLPF